MRPPGQTDTQTDDSSKSRGGLRAKKLRGVFLVNLSNSTVKRDQTTLSIKRTLAFNKGSIFFFHNNTQNVYMYKGMCNSRFGDGQQVKTQH